MLQKSKPNQESFAAVVQVIKDKTATSQDVKKALEKFVQKHGAESINWRGTFFAKINLDKTNLNVGFSGNILGMIILCNPNRSFLNCLLPYRQFIVVDEPINEVIAKNGREKLPYKNLTALQWVLLMGNSKLSGTELINYIEFFVLFLKANPNTVIPIGEQRNESLLHFVIKLDVNEETRLHIVKILLSHEADANKTGVCISGVPFTPLLLAVLEKRSIEVIKILIESGATDLCQQEFLPAVKYPIAGASEIKWNYIMWIIYFKRYDALECLLDHLIKTPEQAKKAIYYASSNHQCSAIRVAIDAEDPTAVQILHRYCQKLNIPTIPLLAKAGILKLLESISRREELYRILGIDPVAINSTHFLITYVQSFNGNGEMLLSIKKLLQQGADPLEHEAVDDEAVNSLSKLAQFISSSDSIGCDINPGHLELLRFIHTIDGHDTPTTNAIIEVLKLFRKIPDSKHHHSLVELLECLLSHCNGLSIDPFFMKPENIINFNLPSQALEMILIKLNPMHAVMLLVQLAKQDPVAFAKLFDPANTPLKADFLKRLIKPDIITAEQPSLLLEMLKSSSVKNIKLLLDICKVKNIDIRGQYAFRISYPKHIQDVLQQYISQETLWNNSHNDLFLIAISFGYPNVNNLLRARLIIARDNNYIQALIIAVCNGDSEMLQFLIHKKIYGTLDINPELNTNGFKLLDLAKLLGHDQIVEVLQQTLAEKQKPQNVNNQSVVCYCSDGFDSGDFAPMSSYAYLIEQNIPPAQIEEWRKHSTIDKQSMKPIPVCSGSNHTWANGRLSSVNKDIKEVEGDHGFLLFVNMNLDHLDKQNLPLELKEQFRKVRPKMHVGIRPLVDNAKANVTLEIDGKKITTALVYELEISEEKRLFGVLVPGDNDSIPILHWVFYGNALHSASAVDSLVQRAHGTECNPVQMPDLRSDCVVTNACCSANCALLL